MKSIEWKIAEKADVLRATGKTEQVAEIVSAHCSMEEKLGRLDALEAGTEFIKETRPTRKNNGSGDNRAF